MARRIVMLGAPASGKGTQAVRLASHFNLPNFSTGALIRGEQERSTDLGRLADKYLAGGGFLPDDLMVEIMASWLDRHGADGFVLDGFPRTIPQVESFDATLAAAGSRLDAVVLLETDLTTLYRRIANRIHCGVCGGTFQLDALGISPGTRCPQAACQGVLAARRDDESATYAARLANYQRLTEPLIQHYLHRANLVRVDGDGSPDDVFARILELLDVFATIKTS